MTDTSTLAVNWLPINDAPHDGREVRLGWFPDGVLEHEVISRWVGGHWEGYWTPTHWRPIKP